MCIFSRLFLFLLNAVCCIQMRKMIEDSSDHRWEFDRKSLFGRTDYMCEICANILEILDALDHFKVFLGPELKAVTGDSAGIGLTNCF